MLAPKLNFHYELKLSIPHYHWLRGGQTSGWIENIRVHVFRHNRQLYICRQYYDNRPTEHGWRFIIVNVYRLLHSLDGAVKLLHFFCTPVGFTHTRSITLIP